VAQVRDCYSRRQKHRSRGWRPQHPAEHLKEWQRINASVAAGVKRHGQHSQDRDERYPGEAIADQSVFVSGGQRSR